MQQEKLTKNSRWPYVLMLAASAVMLSLCQAPFSFGFLGWVCLVPFLIVCADDKNSRIGGVGWWCYGISIAYWLVNLYWLSWVTAVGWVGVCFYLGLYWPICMKVLRWMLKRRVPLWAAAAVMVVGAEFFQGIIWRGFAWRYLGHSQYENITIIQIADIFGAGGVSFLVAMVNGVVAGLLIDLRGKKILRKANVINIVIVSAVVISAIVYGHYRIAQTDEFISAGPRVGVVQSNVVVKLGGETQEAGKIFVDMLGDSREAMAAGADLVVWPETMVEAVIDEKFLAMVGDDHLGNIFNSALKRHSSEGIYLMVGAFGGDAFAKDGFVEMEKKYNSAFLYTPDGNQAEEYYNKTHLVPFGEYVPFEGFGIVNKIMGLFASYGYDYSMDEGDEYTIFEMKDGEKTCHFSAMICYEDTVPKIARKMVTKSNGQKQIEMLVNISNDGWFSRSGKDGSVKGSTELTQHTAICAFRAVENRISIVRSVNTGVSCVIDSVGRIRNEYEAGNLDLKWKKRAGKRGWLVDEVTIDKRVTVFSGWGGIIEIICGIMFTIIAVLSIYKQKSKV